MLQKEDVNEEEHVYSEIQCVDVYNKIQLL
jgi:hypothetical protein